MSTSSLAERQGWLQSNVRMLGSYASTSTPSYALSALFALSTPFGFASPAQAAAEAAAKLQHQQHLARASEAAQSRGSSSLVARLVANAQSKRTPSHAPVRVLPPFWQLAFFATAFGAGGYMIDQRDALNGSGVVTAWSLTYLLFKTAPTIKQLPRNPLAMSLSAAVLVLGFGVHASYYFDQTSWRGAVPSLSAPAIDSDTVKVKEAVAKRPSIFASTQPQASSGSTRDSTRDAIGGGRGNNDLARAAAFKYRRGEAA